MCKLHQHQCDLKCERMLCVCVCVCAETSGSGNMEDSRPPSSFTKETICLSGFYSHTQTRTHTQQCECLLLAVEETHGRSTSLVRRVVSFNFTVCDVYSQS